MLGNLVSASDAEIDTALAHERGYVGGREEDESDGKVFHECDVEARVSMKQDVGAGEEVESCFIEAALFCEMKRMIELVIC